LQFPERKKALPHYFFSVFFSPMVSVAGVRDRLRGSAGIGAHFRRKGCA
jgi:hypothetical protein